MHLYKSRKKLYIYTVVTVVFLIILITLSMVKPKYINFENDINQWKAGSYNCVILFPILFKVLLKFQQLIFKFYGISKSASQTMVKFDN